MGLYVTSNNALKSQNAGGSTSKASDRNDRFFFFYHPRSLSTLKNQNRAKVYLRGTLSQSETWLVSCIFFQVQPQWSNRPASVLWRQKAQAVWPHQREGPGLSSSGAEGQEKDLMTPPNLEWRYWMWTRDSFRTEENNAEQLYEGSETGIAAGSRPQGQCHLRNVCTELRSTIFEAMLIIHHCHGHWIIQKWGCCPHWKHNETLFLATSASWRLALPSLQCRTTFPKHWECRYKKDTAWADSSDLSVSFRKSLSAQRCVFDSGCSSLQWTVWCGLPNASGMGREDHTRNTLCARWLLQDVRLDEMAKAREWGGDVWRGHEGERSCPKPIPGEYFCSVLSGTRWSAVYSAGFS